MNVDDESDKVTFAQVHDYAMGLSGWLTSNGFKKVGNALVFEHLLNFVFRTIYC